MAGADRPGIGNGDANNASGITDEVVADGGLVVDIWFFLLKLELSNYLM